MNKSLSQRVKKLILNSHMLFILQRSQLAFTNVVYLRVNTSKTKSFLPFSKNKFKYYSIFSQTYSLFSFFCCLSVYTSHNDFQFIVSRHWNNNIFKSKRSNKRIFFYIFLQHLKFILYLNVWKNINSEDEKKEEFAKMMIFFAFAPSFGQ